MQVVVDSLLTQYTRLGKGKSIVVLPGWADDSKNWGPFQQQMANDFDVIVIDLPGFGGTQPPKTAWGLTEYASFVGAFLKKTNIQPSAIIGHSNGGAVALRGLASGQFSVDKLVLLASAGIRNRYKGRKKILRLITKSGKILTLPLPSGVKQRLRRTVYRTIGSDMLVAEHLQETFKKVVEDDVQTDASRINLPTLLIYGEKDQEAPVWYGEQFHQLITDSTLEVLPGVGHFVYLDRPKEVIKSILEFLA
jgi:pimeloyl-ACP methyl ester carboxylesterase